MSANTRPALFDQYPRLAERIAWTSLGVQATPLETVQITLPEGGARTVLVKRDDLTARPYGGNKVRKLEFLLGDVMSSGATRVLTAGAAGSHHALATAVYARALGLDVALVLFPQSRTPHVRRTLLLDHALGAELRFTPRMESVPLALMRARLAYRKQRPYLIAPGGSDPIGTLGYVSAGIELASQVQLLGDPPARIYAAAGTLGTVAGLAIGLALADVEVPIAATRITSRLVTNQQALAKLIERTITLLGNAGAPRLHPTRALAMIELRHEQLGAGYGRETEAGREATAVFAQSDLALDATYTAKAAADLIADVKDNNGLPLFLHTLSAFEPDVPVDENELPRDLPEPFRRYLTH